MNHPPMRKRIQPRVKYGLLLLLLWIGSSIVDGFLSPSGQQHSSPCHDVSVSSTFEVGVGVCRRRKDTRRRCPSTRLYEMSTKGDDSKEQGDTNSDIPQQLVSRKRQQRRKPRNRRPRYYWTNPKNIRREIEQFWSDCGLDSTSSTKNNPLMIPNESLLHHYGRHDLRAALQSAGGREVVAEQLGGDVQIMPGRWSEAVQEHQIQALLEIDNSLSPDLSPTATASSTEDKWSHQSDRKPKGYWNLTVVIAELYEYVDGVREEHGRPAVWMPRPNEMTASGRDDLRQAMQRFGGTKNICRLAGMVPFREWYFFEGQLELLMLLKEYIDEHEQGDYTSFPNVSDIRRNGYEKLHSLIQYYGGRKYLAFRLGMRSGSLLPADDFVGVNWGCFDLVFAIALLNFVRQDHMRRNPPMKAPLLIMPRREKLLAEESWLHDRVEEYGGYENVARRLGLAFFD
eukprot:scaffold2290_cov170-Amphora_coffeaeformis.AAC.16